jgi:hypothetical protein
MDMNMDGGRGWVWSGYNPTATPTAKYIHPQNNVEMISSGGGGGGGNQGANGGSGNKVSGDGGKTDDNNENSGGAGGGAAPPSEGGNGGNSSVRNPSYNGNGGKGIISSITGKDVEYGGGGAAGRWNGEVNRNGISTNKDNKATMNDISSIQTSLNQQSIKVKEDYLYCSPNSLGCK